MGRQLCWQLFLLFFTFLSGALAASPTSFCKCTCFTNSTIIPLDNIPPPDSPTSTTTAIEDRNILSIRDSPSAHHRTCNDCNKQFCLDYNLPICKDATDEDVLTTCFQRDSTKDELIVFIFIFATVALLGWAGIKPWLEKFKERQKRGTYSSVSD